MQALKNEDIASFKVLLSRQLEELLNRVNQTVGDLINTNQDSGDIVDRATVECHQSSKLRIRERESRLIRKIQFTLQKIDEGLFGICEKCGDDIPLPRLNARPVAAHCIQCKTQMESLEKAVGVG